MRSAFVLTSSLVVSVVIAPAAFAAEATCSELAVNPAHGLFGNPLVKSVNSAIIPPSGPNRACERLGGLWTT